MIFFSNEILITCSDVVKRVEKRGGRGVGEGK